LLCKRISTIRKIARISCTILNQPPKIISPARKIYR
jgi:hypothetical protein